MQELSSAFAGELTVLLVEDDAVTRKLVAAQLRGMFKELLLAANGQEGLAIFQARSPRIILTDHVMPVLSGLDMAEAIRKLDSRIPIIFITASMDTALLVRAINLGISSIIPKPVVRDNLRHAVSLVVGMLENEYLQKKNVEQELALLQFRERYHEFQQELAFRKEVSILENDYLYRSFAGDPGSGRGEWIAQVEYCPHDIMCGDSYSLRRLPDGSQLVFIADAMGKGLAASLTTSLSVYTFNLLVDALPGGPFWFEDFVSDYTALMRKRLLEDEVLTLGLAWLPAMGTGLELATFGMPPILVVTPGEPVVRLRCNNPPLSAYVDTFRTTSHDLGQARAMLLHTDGLNEALSAEGELYRDHLEAHLQACTSRAQFWAAFRAEVPVPDDDVTFLLLTRVDAPPLWKDVLTIESRLDKVEEAIQRVERALESCLTLGAEARFEFAMAVREALLNAYEHGSLEISAAQKHRLLQDGLFYDHLLERETTQDRLITLEGSFQLEGDNHLLKVTVTDEGPGFTPPKYWFNEPDSILLNGRGLKMVRKYTDAFYFNEKGNAITLVKIYSGGSDATGADDCERNDHHRQHQDHG